jgi:LssY C-terminus
VVADALSKLVRPLPFGRAVVDLGTIPLPFILYGVAGLLALALALLFIYRVARNLRLLDTTSREGRRISAESSGTHPLTNFTRSGAPSDPLNIKIVATGPQLATAFAAAGWYRADEIAVITSMRITLDAILRRQYPSAPVSSLYLYGRVQDYAFQCPGSSVHERDHVRFWDTGARAKDGRPIWVGAATEDIAVKISRATYLPTHRIAPDVDRERNMIMRELIESGWVIDQKWEPGYGKPIETKNAAGDPYFTDGRVAVLALADIPVLPFADEVHGPLLGPAQLASWLLRWRLPKIGRARAKAEKKAEREEERKKAGVTAGRSD